MAIGTVSTSQPIRISTDSYDDWVYIDKTTNKYTYNKNEDISVALNIFATRNEHNIIIRDEIPQEFQYIGSKSSTEYHCFYDNNSNQIIFRDINFVRNNNRNPTVIKYKIKTQRSNTYILGTLSLVFEGNTYLFPSPEIKVVNRLPNLTIEDYPKIKSWEGETNYISALVDDPDNDSVSCSLYLDRIKILKPKYSINKSGEKIYYKYIWDLSGIGPGSHTLYLKANDDEDTTRTEDLIMTVDKKFLDILPIPDYILASIFTFLGFLIVIFRENIRDLFLRFNQKKEDPERSNQLNDVNRLKVLKEMLDSGLINEEEYIKKKNDILSKL
jgi:hypothetical protein